MTWKKRWVGNAQNIFFKKGKQTKANTKGLQLERKRKVSGKSARKIINLFLTHNLRALVRYPVDGEEWPSTDEMVRLVPARRKRPVLSTAYNEAEEKSDSKLKKVRSSNYKTGTIIFLEENDCLGFLDWAASKKFPRPQQALHCVTSLYAESASISEPTNGAAGYKVRSICFNLSTILYSIPRTFS